MFRIEGGVKETVVTPIKAYRGECCVGYFRQIANEFVFCTTIALDDQRTSGIRYAESEMITAKLKELNSNV